MKTITTTDGEYKFDEVKHFHYLNGEKLTGVTTVLGVIAKPMLIPWAAGEVVKYIKENTERISMKDLVSEKKDYGYFVSEEMLELARKAHTAKKEKAGAWGEIVHKVIELWIKTGEVVTEVTIKCETYPVTPDHMKAVNHFTIWATQHNVKFIHSEQNVYSKEMWVGGIADLVIELDGKRLVGDIKTSSGIYNEHFFQAAAYDICLEEMGLGSVEGYLIINLKKDGTMDMKIAENKEINREAFRSALSLYRIQQSLK